MKNVVANVWYWSAGIVAAAGGIVLARVVAPHATDHRLALTVGGQILAFAGLLVICVGVSRRVNRPKVQD